MMHSHRKFNLAFLFFLSTLLCSSIIFNLIIDPYSIWGYTDITGINHVKIKKLAKSIAVIRLRPKTILMGSSRTIYGLNPSHRVFDPQTGVYNLGTSGPDMGLVAKYFDHALINQPDLKNVVVGIDFFMFNELYSHAPDSDEELISQKKISLKYILNALLTLDALRAGISTVRLNLGSPFEKPEFLPNGMGDMLVVEKRMMTEAKKFMSRKVLFEGPLKEYFKTTGPKKVYGVYRYSKSALKDLARIISTCREKRIRLTLFISPSHATEWEAIRLAGYWREFENWKRDVAAMYPLWDFSGYNSVTTEEIGENMKNHYDHSHYTPRIGDLALNRMFHFREDEVPKDFGVLLTPENVRTHCLRIRAEQAAWIRENAPVVAWMKKLQSEAN